MAKIRTNPKKIPLLIAVGFPASPVALWSITLDIVVDDGVCGVGGQGGVGDRGDGGVAAAGTSRVVTGVQWSLRRERAVL